MRQTELFTRTRREAPSDEVSRNAKLLIRAGFIHKELAGVYSYLPLGLLTLKKLENIIRREMNETLGAQEVFLSALHPLENYETTGRDKIDVLFHTELKAGGRLVLGQSHEEVIVPLLKNFISSHRDLPLSVYQFQTKFRNELRVKSGIMRGREFLMKDLYSFHADEKDFEEYYARAQEAYRHIYRLVGLGDLTYLTYAAGGTFSKYSHEFQTLTEAGEDTIYVCPDCQVALNDELSAEQKTCPKCTRLLTELKPQKAIEVGNIFPLKTRFSDAFNLVYRAENGENQPVIMGCYGLGVSRLLGAIAEALSDEHGLVWPAAVAPFTVHLLTLGTKDASLIETSQRIYKMLLGCGQTVLWDDRALSPGEKLADADLIGLPYRVVVSPKTIAVEQVEIKNRADGAVRLVTENQLCALVG